MNPASMATRSVRSVMDGQTGALPAAMTKASTVAEAHGSYTWLGFLARVILWSLQTVSTVLYFSIKLVTISIPTFLFAVFSASWTITMNATTL